MFFPIYLFEIKFWLKKPATYVYFGIFFLITFLLVLVVGGAFPGLATGSSQEWINSATAIAGITNGINFDLIGLMILIGIIAPAVYKDFQYNTHSLIFTKPISKFSYLGGRFLGALTVCLLIISASLLGHMLASSFPGLNKENFGPFSFWNYFQTIIYFYLPNMLFIGSLFFSMVTFTRNLMSGYLMAILLVVLKGVAGAYASKIEYEKIIAILEPFGEQALRYETKFWTIEDTKHLAIPFSGYLMYNRILWTSISVLGTLFAFSRFSFSQFLSPIKFFWQKTVRETASAYAGKFMFLSDMPASTIDESFRFKLKQILHFAKLDFKYITRSILFVIIVLLGILGMFLAVTNSGAIYGTATHPVTYQILDVGVGFFTFFLLLMTVFYSGTLIWRDRDSKMDELVGSSPVSEGVMFFSKYFAIVGVQSLMLLIIVLTGIGIQLSQGFTDLNIDVYFKELFGLKLIGFAITTALCLFIQVLFNNKYVGYFFSIFFMILIPVLLGYMELNNKMYRFNSTGPTLPYSDMNGYGHGIFSYFIFKSYWFMFALILMTISMLFFVRSKEKGFNDRIRVAKSRMNKSHVLLLAFSFIGFAGFGSYIYYNIKVVNKFRTPAQEEEMQANYEKKYKKFKKLNQPKVTAVNLNVDIFPAELAYNIKGYYFIKNKSQKNIDSVLLSFSDENEVSGLLFERPTKEIFTEKDYKFSIYKLSTPLIPGDSIKLDFTLKYKNKGFSNSTLGTSVVYNGTFFNSDVLPHIGYRDGMELSDKKTREKYKLAPQATMAKPTDTIALMNNYISDDADWVSFETVVSTCEDQIAIAPGYLQKEWKEGNRKYFHYKMNSPILHFVSFLSARYEVKKDKWKDVNIEIYYQKGHEYNLDRMISGIKDALSYYTKNFSPYQHKQVRILEFPRYATFAQSFPNTIPYSESIGFIAKVDEKDPLSIDYIYFVTAHEVAHQWWAHQVMGGAVQGCTVMSESMSEYAALKVMEKKYGQENMQKFLRYEMNSYLKGRTDKSGKERALMYNENQQYIHYNKGSVVLYALSDYIGEDSLNSALKKYIKKAAYKARPYTSSVEFVSFLRKSTPDSLQYVITDLFETITLFENRTTSFTSEKLPNGKYKVKIGTETYKFRSDSVGKQTDVKLNDWIDIGVFSTDKSKDKMLYLKKHKITSKNQVFEIIVDQKPDKVGIDPYNKLIDRSPENNSLKAGEKPSPAQLVDSGGISVAL